MMLIWMSKRLLSSKNTKMSTRIHMFKVVPQEITVRRKMMKTLGMVVDRGCNALNNDYEIINIGTLHNKISKIFQFISMFF